MGKVQNAKVDRNGQFDDLHNGDHCRIRKRTVHSSTYVSYAAEYGEYFTVQNKYLVDV